MKKAAEFSARCRARVVEHWLPPQQLLGGFASRLKLNSISTYFGECGHAVREQRNSQMISKDGFSAIAMRLRLLDTLQHIHKTLKCRPLTCFL